MLLENLTTAGFESPRVDVPDSNGGGNVGSATEDVPEELNVPMCQHEQRKDWQPPRKQIQQGKETKEAESSTGIRLLEH